MSIIGLDVGRLGLEACLDGSGNVLMTVQRVVEAWEECGIAGTLGAGQFTLRWVSKTGHSRSSHGLRAQRLVDFLMRQQRLGGHGFVLQFMLTVTRSAWEQGLMDTRPATVVKLKLSFGLLAPHGDVLCWARLV